MSSYFHYRWRPSLTEPDSVLVVCAANNVFVHQEMVGLLDEDRASDFTPDAIVFVVPTTRVDAFADGARRIVADRVTMRRGAEDIPIYTAAFDAHGDCAGFAHVSGGTRDWGAGAFASLRKHGLLTIFEKRRVLMPAGPGLHFVHPRGVHSRAFLRGANAFVSGAETGFVAMTLLGRMREVPRRIWIDTSSIASVAYAMTSLRQTFDHAFDPPHIESFSSYEGLGRQELEHANRALFLISATASGAMARDIARQEAIERKRIVNLFSGAPQADDIDILCDVHDHRLVLASDGDSILRVAPAGDCPWCRDNSRLVRFVSDQFLAEADPRPAVGIAEDDGPPTLADTMHRFCGRAAFLIERREATGNHKFNVDAAALTHDGAVEGLDTAVRRFVPMSVSHVVHLDDDGSRQMGEAIVAQIARETTLRPELRAASDLSAIHEPRAVVVAAACIGGGNALHVVSRALRPLLQDRPRIYLVGFAKQKESRRQRTLSSDLAHNKSHANQVVVLHGLTLPAGDLNAWERERRLLNHLREGADDAGKLAFLEARLAQLGPALIGGGFELFLPGPDGRPLELSPGFAFWKPGYEDRRVSHGDVLASVAAVLENMRTKTPRAGGEPKLVATTFNVAVISPGVFDRYNDGVIQAAILRSAHVHELDYSGRLEESATMLRFLKRAIERWRTSEACPEFLMALATGRLLLAERDQASLAAAQSADPTPQVALLLEAVRSRAWDKMATA